jgi:HK97 family phage portal protein
MGGSQSISGEVVTEETALTYSAVWNAITLISGTIGSLPLHLMRPDGRDKKQATEQNLYHVLHTQYNPFMTAMAGRECMTAHILTWGNGYAEIVRDGYGDVRALWPIAPNRVSVSMEEGNLIYTIRLVDGAEVALPREKILHIAGLGFDGFQGYSIIAMARKSIGLSMAMETFGSRYFGHGTHPSAVVTHPNQVKDPKKMREALSEVYAGLGNSHRLMLLEDGMDIKNIGIPPEDSQFLESRQFQVPEVARWFNLPPHKLKDLTKSSFNNIEAEQASFITDSILPWLIRFEQNYNMQLITPAQQKRGFYFKHIVEGLLRANSIDRSAFYKALISIGVMTPNEAREKEDLNPSDDPLADELWMPTGQIPMSKFQEYLDKNQSRQAEPEKAEESEAKPKALKLIKEG